MSPLYRSVSVVAGLLVLVLVLTTTASVVARYAFNAPFQWTEEFSGLLMIWIVFFGAIGCEIKNEHLTIDVVTAMLPQRLRRAIALVVGIASVALLGVMAWLGWVLSVSAMTKQTRLLGISWFWIDLAVVVGAVGIGAVLLTRVVLAIAGRTPLDDPGFDPADPTPTSEKEAVR